MSNLALKAPQTPALLRNEQSARGFAEASTAMNTNRAYEADWRHYTSWTRRHGLPETPPDPQVIGLYISACADPPPGVKPNSVSTISRRVSALAWHFAQAGLPFDRSDRHVASVLAGIRRTLGRPPDRKAAIFRDDLLAMIDTLDLASLRGLRDRAILLVGFAGALRRSEIVGLHCRKVDLIDDEGRAMIEGKGWCVFEPKGLMLNIHGKTGWREVAIGPGSSGSTCPIVALRTWLDFAGIVAGPIFRRVIGANVAADALDDKQVSRIVKRCAMAAGVRGDLSEGDRARAFSGHSLRAGLASSADIDERYAQKQLGHASPEMTRRYQRERDRYRVNLTKAAGL